MTKIRFARCAALLLAGLLSLAQTSPFVSAASGAPQSNLLDPSFRAPTLTQAQNADKTFVLPDDRFYLYSGNSGFPTGFNRLAGEQRGDLILCQADGSVDPAFRLDPRLHGYYVNAVAPTSDGRLIIAAARPFNLILSLQYFYTIARFQVFRLNADGSLDASFNAGSGTEPLVGDNEENGAAAFLRAVVVQPDGKILVGGQFQDFSGSGYSDLVRLNADGSVDKSFAAQSFRASVVFGGQPTGIASGNQNLLLQPDGKIIVAGAFDQLGGVRYPGIARLNADGSLDRSFVPSGIALALDTDFGGAFPVRSAELRADGKIIVGGPISPSNDPNVLRPLARLNADGSLDRLFDPLTDPSTGEPLNFFFVLAVRQTAGGRVFASTTTNVYFFNEDGTFGGNILGADELTSSYDPLFSNTARLSLQSGGRLLVTGIFDAINGAPRPGGLARYAPGANGSYALDPAFSLAGPLADNVFVGRIGGVRSDGTILVQGAFDSVNGEARPSVALLNADGSLNAQIPASPDLFSDPLELLVPSALGLPDDKTLHYGPTLDEDFNTGFAYRRLNADGTPDDAFQPDASVAAFQRPILQPDGKLLISRGVIYGAESNSDGPQAILDGTLLQRLNADGSVDAGFAFGLDLSGLIQRAPDTQAIVRAPNGDSRAVAVLPDGRILYKYFDGENFILARLLADGSADPSFQPGAAAGLGATLNVKSGQPFIVDPVTGSEGTPAEGTLSANGVGIANVLALPDGRMLAAGDFTSYNGVPAGGLVRLKADGTVDTAFRPNLRGAAFTAPSVVFAARVSVDDVQLETDGKLLLVGSFDAFDGVPAPGIVRLNFDGTVDGSFAPPVKIRATGGSFSLAFNNSLFPLPDGGFLLAGNYAAPGDDLRAGPQALFRLTASKPRKPVLTVVASVPETAEGSDEPGVILVARAGDLTRDLTVNYQVTGRAVNGADYVMLTGAKRLAPGKSTVKLKVKPVDNSAPDGNRGVKVTLLPGQGYQLGDLIKAKVRISDND